MQEHLHHLQSDKIQVLENNQRGFYAGACGFIHNGESEFMVGIRSAYINKNQIHIYGGAGIVNASNYENEWKETEEKMKNFSFLWS